MQRRKVPLSPVSIFLGREGSARGAAGSDLPGLQGQQERDSRERNIMERDLSRLELGLGATALVGAAWKAPGIPLPDPHQHGERDGAVESSPSGNSDPQLGRQHPKSWDSSTPNPGALVPQILDQWCPKTLHNSTPNPRSLAPQILGQQHPKSRGAP